MSEPYIGEIKIVAFDFAPRGYAKCDGSILAINQNQALFSILGTTYGGNGTTNFALPELRGRVPIHVDFQASSPFPLGGKGGVENVTLTTAEIPTHTHQLNATKQAPAQPTPVTYYMPTLGDSVYAPSNSANSTMVNNEVSNNGGGQGHTNMQPYLVLNIIIALTGIFPPRN
ncbi:tail fiber protein [soil metagenome]